MVQAKWTQPFHWGLLLAYDQDGHFETPHLDRSGQIAATGSCLAVPVRHSQDIELSEQAGPDDVLPWALVRVTVVVAETLQVPAEFAGPLRCPSGRLIVGDAEQHRVVSVPTGDLFVHVARDAEQHAEHVSLAISAVA